MHRTVSELALRRHFYMVDDDDNMKNKGIERILAIKQVRVEEMIQ